MSGAISGWGREGVLLAFNKQKPEMLQKILECLGQAPQQRSIWPKMSGVLPEKPWTG